MPGTSYLEQVLSITRLFSIMRESVLGPRATSLQHRHISSVSSYTFPLGCSGIEWNVASGSRGMLGLASNIKGATQTEGVAMFGQRGVR
jgi:hypothetical protein